MSGRVTVTADNEFARLSLASFGSNHMDNPLQLRSVSCVLNAKLLDIVRKLINLSLRNRISDVIDIDSGDIVIKSSKG